MNRHVRLFFLLPLFGLFATGAAQDPLIAKVQQRLEQQHDRQKQASYCYLSTTLIYKLDKQGGVEKLDTVKQWQKFVNDSLVTDSLVYSTIKPGKKGKKGEQHSESAELPKLTDPAIECSVEPASDGLARILFKPKKPKGGDIAGELFVDPATGAMKKCAFYMPRLKWPVKEFAMRMDWTEAGGVLIPSYIWMQAAWNAIISSGRMRVETTISDLKVE